MQTFTVTDEQEAQIEAWHEELRPLIAAIRLEKLERERDSLLKALEEGTSEHSPELLRSVIRHIERDLEGGHSLHYQIAYGDLEYRFTCTGIGTACCVYERHTGEEINVTDYENW